MPASLQSPDHDDGRAMSRLMLCIGFGSVVVAALLLALTGCTRGPGWRCMASPTPPRDERGVPYEYGFSVRCVQK